MIFVGGVHGVGKSTLSNGLAPLLGRSYYTASALIKAANPSSLGEGKIVKNIAANQRLLISAVQDLSINKSIILDGHFSLLSEEGVELVPSEVFLSIKPKLFLIVSDDVNKIYDRTILRDGVSLEKELIEAHQKIELGHAKAVSELLGIDLLQVTPGQYELKELVSQINSMCRKHP